jgi:hypothetical protein
MLSTVTVDTKSKLPFNSYEEQQCWTITDRWEKELRDSKNTIVPRQT